MGTAILIEKRTRNMGGDIAGWSARQEDASYDERDQISIVTVLKHDAKFEDKHTNCSMLQTQNPSMLYTLDNNLQ